MERSIEKLANDDFTFVALLKACAKKKDLHKGVRLHASILRRGLIGKSHYVSSALIDMYAKCGDLATAQNVLEELPVQTTVAWNALIAGYAQQNHGFAALDCFRQMLLRGFCPNTVTFLCVLKACGKAKAIDKGKEIHCEIMGWGLLELEKHVSLGNALVDMYAKCGALERAQAVLEALHVRDIVSWNAIISAFTHYGQLDEALSSFKQMQAEGLIPDAVTLICILKSCSSKGDVDEGKRIHQEIVCRGLLENDTVKLGTALLDMYAKCGVLTEAQEVLEELPGRDVVSWNALVAGYIHQGQDAEAMNCFQWMRSEGFSPNAVSYICILKACGNLRATEEGKRIHSNIVDAGLLSEEDGTLGNALIDMYVKCDMLEHAQEVLRELEGRNTISYNTTLIAGYAGTDRVREALGCLESSMQKEHGLSPDSVTILKACGSRKELISKGKEMHDETVGTGLLDIKIHNTVLGNSLVGMYMKCGLVSSAEQVFEELHLRDVLSWNALIAGYVQHGQGQEAVNVCHLMQGVRGVHPDGITFVCILKALSSVGIMVGGLAGILSWRTEGDVMHRYIKFVMCRELQEVPSSVAAQLHEALTLDSQDRSSSRRQKLLEALDYLRSSAIMAAELAIEEAGAQNSSSTVGAHFLLDILKKSIAWYSQRGRFHDALNCLERSGGVCIMDVPTLVRILKACGKTGTVKKGRQIHEEIVRRGLLLDHLHRNVVLGNALVYMYTACGLLLEARQLVEEGLPVCDVVTWATLLAGYTRVGLHQEALHCFQRMEEEGYHPNAVTFAFILKACGCVGSVEAGERIHEQMVKRGVLAALEKKTNVVLATALMDMYGRCGVLTRARDVLAELSLRDVVAWNVVIAGYARHGQWHETWDCFRRMECEALAPDAVTFISSLKCAASVDQKGLQIHSKIVSMGLMQKDVVLGTALVSMYARCGWFVEAQQLLDQLPARNVVSWNVMIAGYAQRMRAEEAVKCLEEMRSEGVSPDQVSLVGVLTACSRSGRMEEAERVFAEMQGKYGIAPSVEHGTCMVTGLGCGGQFDKAMSMIRGMPCFDSPAVWRALLAGCRKWANAEVGRLAFHEAEEVGRRRRREEGDESPCASTYMMLMAAISQPDSGGEMVVYRK